MLVYWSCYWCVTTLVTHLCVGCAHVRMGVQLLSHGNALGSLRYYNGIPIIELRIVVVTVLRDFCNKEGVCVHLNFELGMRNKRGALWLRHLNGP